MREPRKTNPVPTVLCVPLALLAAAALRAFLVAPPARMEFQLQLDHQGMEQLVYSLTESPRLDALFLAPATNVLLAVLAGAGAFWAAASLVGMLFRRRWALGFVRAAWIGVFFVSAVAFVAVFQAAGRVSEAYRAANPEAQDVAIRAFLLRWGYLRWAVLACAVAAGMLVLSWRAGTIALYARPPAAAPATGDELLEGARTGGADPRYRRSWLSSTGLHWFVIVALPFLWALRGCIQPYLVPYGSGKAAVVRVMKVVKKKKPRKKYIVRANAAIYWDIPDLNESKIAQEVNEQTQLTHVADRNAVHGQMGAGGGNKGGWPDGVPGGRIRFIRLEYSGRDWDDGMDAGSRADINFLDFLRKEVPFPVARKSESHRINLLARYPKAQAPPFVYMTGSDSIHVSSADARILREYLLDGGGMLFADAGTSRWDWSFRGFLKQVFPDKRLIDIADDDEIYQMPYAFPNGAPPLWHHGGFRAMGIKHRGRWVVFYHPGDINDAWKTGHSGLDPETADKACQMGINIMYYSITKYLELTRKYRK